MKPLNLLRIVWPSFLITIAQVGVLFTFIDPSDIRWLSETYELSRQAVYTFGFFLLGHGQRRMCLDAVPCPTAPSLRVAVASAPLRRPRPLRPLL